MGRAVLVLALAAALLAGGCGDSDAAEDEPSEVEGRVTEVNEEGGSVSSFVVEAEDRTYELAIDPSVAYGFDLAHLHEHRETGDPVLCRVAERDGVLYALEIHDA